MLYYEKVGNTPMARISFGDFPAAKIHVKLEYYNPTGSVKDRAAFYLLKNLLDSGTITKNTTIIESTSGNFGIALAGYCKYFGLKFIAVIDKNITDINEKLLRLYGAEVIQVEDRDRTGGYLLTRIQRVNTLLEEIEDSYWVNQYNNEINADAYYHTLGREICDEVTDIDFVFLGVSSGGTIAGVSRRVAEVNENTKIIAVDIKGSVIFEHESKKRYIPGIGSSMRPGILDKAIIDEYILIDESETIKECIYLLESHGIFAGGSSGSVCAGIKKYLRKNGLQNKELNIVTIFPDSGERYINTVYNPIWCEENLNV